MSDLIKRVFIGSLIGLVVGVFVAFSTEIDGFFLTSLLDGYEYRSYDARMKAKSVGVEESSIEDIVIIDIEQNSIEMLGNYYDWPHAYHGQLIDVVTSGKPKALLFDIIFDPENTSTYHLVNEMAGQRKPTEDVQNYLKTHNPNWFVNSTAMSDNVYHALSFENSDSLNFLYAMDSEPEGYDPTNHILILPEDQAKQLPTAERIGNTYSPLIGSGRGAGSVRFPQDEDGITRRAPTAVYFEGSNHVYPSLSMAVVKDVLGVPQDGFEYDFEDHVLRLSNADGMVIREIPIDDHGRMYVNYQGSHKTFYYLPYAYCMDADMLPPEYWEKKIAIVGASLPGLMDLRNTPVQETYAGVEIHANVMYSVLKSEFVKPTGDTTKLWTLILLSIILGVIISLPPKALYSLSVPIVGAMVWVVFAYSRFLSNLEMWDIVRPLMVIGLTYISIFIYNFLVSEKDKRFLRNTFGTYISPDLIEQMVKDKNEPELGGVAGHHTVYFSDIQSFSSFSEVLKPVKMVRLMNEYLSAMTDILLKNQGTLDKYIGDAIVAFWGAPAPVENHEYLSCKTALEMKEALTTLCNHWKEEGGWPEIVINMQHRIGLSSGEVVTGNMGSNVRMNYTMMGDVVNLGARLESSAKQYGVYIHVEETLQKTVKDQFEWRFLDYVRVKGRTTPVKTFELLAFKGGLDSKTEKCISLFYKAQKLYFEQRWDEAVTVFKDAEKSEDMFKGRSTNPSTVYLARCDYLKKHPPGKDWDGVWTLTTK